MVKALDLSSNGRLPAWVQTPLLALFFYYFLKFLCIEFNAIPEGTASIAQVHKAILDGEEVAIKIQHKDISANAAADIKLLTKLSDFSKWVFGKRFNFQWLVDEIKELLDTELDFRNEASNATEARQNHAHFPWLVIPKIHQEYTTKRIQSVKKIIFKVSGK